MAEFRINQEVTTDTPTVEVTLSANNPLPIGRHTFRLVVVDDSGDTQAVDSTPVPSGTGHYYLVCAENTCGRGTAGQDTGATEGNAAACP